MDENNMITERSYMADSMTIVMEPSVQKESYKLPLVNPDFGDRVYVKTLHHSVIGEESESDCFSVVQPIEIAVYKGDDSFTATAYPFTRMFGYGHTRDAAYDELIVHLISLRKRYGDLKDHEATPNALKLRDMLFEYMKKS